MAPDTRDPISTSSTRGSLPTSGPPTAPAANWAPNAVRSGRLVTGQNPAPATGVAAAVVAALA